MEEPLERKNIEKKKIDWNEHASYWDEFEGARTYTKQSSALLSETINLENLRILDFGSGTGILTEYMATKAKEIVAVDTSEKMIEVLDKKKLANVTTIVDELSQKTVDSNPALQDKFDLVVASSVCAFLPNYEEVLSIIKSLLKPEGVFVQWDWLKTDAASNFGFTEEMIRAHYGNVGLKVDSVSVPFYLMEKDEKMEVLMAVGKV